MEAGRLRNRIDIQRPTKAPDTENEYGQAEPPEFVTVSHGVPAEVRPLRAYEIVRAQQPVMDTDHVVRMRYREDVTPDCRLLWGDKKLYVTGIIDVGGRRRELEVMCRERDGKNGV